MKAFPKITDFGPGGAGAVALLREGRAVLSSITLARAAEGSALQSASPCPQPPSSLPNDALFTDAPQRRPIYRPSFGLVVNIPRCCKLVYG